MDEKEIPLKLESNLIEHELVGKDLNRKCERSNHRYLTFLCIVTPITGSLPNFLCFVKLDAVRS